MNIFEKFLPSNSSFQENSNVLVVDFGDGEVVIYRVINGNINRLEIQNGKNKCTQALTGGESLKSLELWNNSEGETPKDNYTYWHYKSLPNEAKSSACVWHNGKLNPGATFTYGELMARSFGSLLKTALNNTNNSSCLGNGWNPEKPTYIFVGRPSAAEWADQELEYREILKSYEKCTAYDSDGTLAKFGSSSLMIGGLTLKKEDIHILIISEADAAYAELVCKSRNGLALTGNEYAIVIDMGSSTIDVIVIFHKELIIKDSIQLGGGDIDSCIMHCIIENNKTIEIDDPVVPLKIREAKENFFKYNKAKGSAKRDYKINFDDGQQITLDEEIMEKAICNTPIVKRGKLYGSWKTGVCEFLKDIKRQIAEKIAKTTEDKLTDHLHFHLYLTGGVSNMWECREWAKEIFSNEPEVPKGVPSPSYVIGEGLAYIASVELQKEKARAEIIKKVNELFAEKKSTFEKSIQKGVGDWLAEAYGAAAKYYKKNMSLIATDLELETKFVRKCFTFIEFVSEQVPYAINPQKVRNSKQYIFLDQKYNAYGPTVSATINVWWSNNEMKTQIAEIVRGCFVKIFPYAEAFEFQPDIEQAESCFKKILFHYCPDRLNRLRFLGDLRKNKPFSADDAVDFFVNQYQYATISSLLSSYEENSEFFNSVTSAYKTFTVQIEEQLNSYIDSITPYRLL